MENQEYKKYSEEQLIEILTVINENASKSDAWLLAMWNGLSAEVKMSIQKIIRKQMPVRNIGFIGHVDHGITTIPTAGKEPIIIVSNGMEDKITEIITNKFPKFYKPEPIPLTKIYSEEKERGTNKRPKKKKRKK